MGYEINRERGPAFGSSSTSKPAAASEDVVNHPSHYKRGDMECIDVTEGMSFLRGNAVKYLWRAGLKKGATDRATAAKEIEDLKKARWYIDREISNLIQTEQGHDGRAAAEEPVAPRAQRDITLDLLITDHIWVDGGTARLGCGYISPAAYAHVPSGGQPCNRLPREHTQVERVNDPRVRRKIRSHVWQAKTEGDRFCTFEYGGPGTGRLCGGLVADHDGFVG